ncbi:MAG: hypothetical protein AMXMBFR4_18720 [Candidatus Hydrogenedentota bacterium]
MQPEYDDREEEFEHLNADAVCEACDHVNPPGTLLCKVCGNNLRDQRARRLAAGAASGEVSESARPRLVLAGLLSILGLLLMIWVGVNVGNIESFLVSQYEAQTRAEFSPENLWIGPDSRAYERLRTDLRGHPLSETDAVASAPGAKLESVDGRSLLKQRDDPLAPILGQALAETDGEVVRVVALFSNGTEARGEGVFRSEGRLETETIGIRRVDGSYASARGFAQPLNNGLVTCSGYISAPPAGIVVEPDPLAPSAQEKLQQMIAIPLPK